MGNDHVSKPDVDAFDDPHPVWKILFVLFCAFMLVFWGAILLG